MVGVMGLMDMLKTSDPMEKFYAAAEKSNVPQGGITGKLFSAMFPHGLGNLAFGRNPEPMPPLETPEGTALMADLASNMMVPGTFIGPKGLARLFGDDAAKGVLATAESKLAQGVPKEAVFQELGVFKGPEGKWRYEIDDSGMGVNWPVSRNGAKFKEQKMSDVIMHDVFSTAYPDVMDYDASIQHGLMRGGFDRPVYGSRFGNNNGRFLISAENANDAADVVTHELQHAIQGVEGFDGGANADSVGWSAYQNSIGEKEAKKAASRRKLSSEMRRYIFPDFF